MDVRCMPIVARCRACGHVWQAQGYRLTCPACGEGWAEVQQGGELQIEGYEAVFDGPSPDEPCLDGVLLCDEPRNIEAR